jgi:hypothetical protein
MGFLTKLFGGEPKETKLLGVSIVTDEDHRYFVSFCRYHPQVHAPDYVRLILHYYAKILSNFDPSGQQMSESGFVLQQLIETLLFKGIRKDSNIMRDVDIEDVARMVSVPPGNVPREILATLSLDNSTRRHVTIHIPKSANAQHMLFSVAALIQATLMKLDQKWVTVLNDSLSNMNKEYDSGQSYSKTQNVTAIPADAYVAATRSRSQQVSQSQDTIFSEPPLLIKNAS